MSKYDVGIIGLWSGCNYGSIATYYALNRVISSMGKSILMIDKPILTDNDFELKETHSRRFGREHYEISNQYRLAEMGKLNELCDAFVIGSDQVWNYGISKNFGKFFYFDFVNPDKKKIAYAVSFGHGVDFAPLEKRGEIAEYMSRFDGISTRENDGVRLCRDEYGIKAKWVLDPVFVADPKEYEPLIEKSRFIEEEPFLATYILDPTPEKRNAILHVQKELGGIKIVNMLDGMPGTFNKNRELTNLPNCIENLQVEDWLYFLSKAKFVITDSCHGASFALIFKRDFIAITNKHRGVSRFKSLSQLFNVENRVVTDPNLILTDSSLLKPMDYGAIDKIMQENRQLCYSWLEEKLNEPKKSDEELRKINVIGKPHTTNEKNAPAVPEGGSVKHLKAVVSQLKAEKCVGCGACVSACPCDAISLQPDKYGYYKAKLDEEKCINCGLCSSVCPALKQPENKNTETPDCYEFVAADDRIVLNSSSGGAFSVLAKEAFNRNGVIAGAAWKDDLTVEHIIIDSENDMPKLRKSKYLQSFLGNKIFKKTKEILDEGRFVLFTGCPCQIAGLRAYLKKDYDNLIMVDLLCGNSPSAGFFKKYIQSLEEANGARVVEYEFRHKASSKNWDATTIKYKTAENNEVVRHGGREDDYQRVYHDHTMCARHCENCEFQKARRFGDITIGDFWWISKRDTSQKFETGVSALIINNSKGQAFVDCIPPESARLMKKVPYTWLSGNGFTIKGSHNHASPSRDSFYEAVQRMPFSKAVDYAQKPNHGIYPHADKSFMLLNTASQYHFSFDRNIWEEHIINDRTTLITRPVNPPTQKYAVISLNDKLDANKRYVLKLKFMVRTNESILNFHVKDSGSNMYQVVYSHQVKAETKGKWIEKEIVFTPNSSLYDEFMIGAAQIKGEDAYITFEYITISELD